MHLLAEVKKNGFASLDIFPDKKYTYNQELLNRAISVILDTKEYKIVYLTVDQNVLDNNVRMSLKFLVGAGLSIPDLRKKLFPTI